MIDSHCHLFMNREFSSEEQIKNAQKEGIKRIINVSTDSKENFNVCRKWIKDDKYKNVFFTLGIHPSEAQQYRDFDIEFIESNIWLDRVIAIGEIGLDYYRGEDFKDKQKELFIKQVQVAYDKKMPVIIHNRMSGDDMLNIIKDYRGVEGVFHCFSGDDNFARKVLDLGFYISFAGNITYNKAHDLRGAALFVPIDRLLIETDAPFLSPVPERGKVNTPSNLKYTASFIAGLKKIELEKFIIATVKNTSELFRLDINN